MPLGWNEIRFRAVQFVREWTGETREQAEAKSFWDDFFEVFGVRRRVVATFEEPVKKLSGTYGYIDLFWPKMLLVEHKSRGEDLGKAGSQAFSYIRDLIREGRAAEVPRYVMVSDFARMALHDLEPEEPQDLPRFEQFSVATAEFPLTEFHRHVQLFAFIPGYQQHRFRDQDPINLQAVAIMGRLHDTLEAGGYRGHDLERFLVRILFCLFAEDTGIFEREAFRLYLEQRTAEDAADLGSQLARLFEVLNTPPGQRQQHLDEALAAFPFVNGALFAERLSFADFNSDMRNALLACTQFDWSRISPAIFGALFQTVMEPRERRQWGGHYTGERDILKVIRPLFLDGLRTELAAIKADRSTRRRARLEEFHAKLCGLRFLDPACGCGNFLVITYRELRRLELEVLQALFGKQAELTLDEINRLSQVDVDQCYGIELLEWPVRIAEVALWLMDHQMNLEVSAAFGQLYQRLPLRASPNIVQGNALRLDWRTVLAPDQCRFVLGNPPFVGAKYQTAEQRADLALVAAEVAHHGLLDYVTGWYFKAAAYILGTGIKVGFVSTNSITQGEQVGVLWPPLFQRYGVKIHFGHRTFPWESEARGRAHVHVVIIGFGHGDAGTKRLYECDADSGRTSVTAAANISPYLVAGPDRAISSRTTPLSTAPEIRFGNQPIDGGHFVLNTREKAELLAKEPGAAGLIRLFLGAHEFINGEQRWCLWLRDVAPAQLRRLPEVMRHVEGVREFRLASRRAGTRGLAATPTQFAFVSQPESEYLLIPSVSSERRRYIPMAFMPPEVIASNLCLLIPGASIYDFGVLTSALHMAWVRQVCGRLESRYRYSNNLVYHNFPWPAHPTLRQRAAVEAAARRVLDARRGFPDNTLADLYDPLAMPPALVRAHADLDRAVDRCYRSEPFADDRQRVEHLFALHEQLSAPLVPVVRPRHSPGPR